MPLLNLLYNTDSFFICCLIYTICQINFHFHAMQCHVLDMQCVSLYSFEKWLTNYYLNHKKKPNYNNQIRQKIENSTTCLTYSQFNWCIIQCHVLEQLFPLPLAILDSFNSTLTFRPFEGVTIISTSSGCMIFCMYSYSYNLSFPYHTNVNLIWVYSRN